MIRNILRNQECGKKLLLGIPIFGIGYSFGYCFTYQIMRTSAPQKNTPKNIEDLHSLSHTLGINAGIFALVGHSPPMAIGTMIGIGMYKMYDDYVKLKLYK